MAVCDVCSREMMLGLGCTDPEYQYADGVVHQRIPHGCDDGPCHGCLAPAGTLHHPGCDAERCPRCQSQFISCDCP
jgi:hypothetical protein